VNNGSNIYEGFFDIALSFKMVHCLKAVYHFHRSVKWTMTQSDRQIYENKRFQQFLFHKRQENSIFALQNIKNRIVPVFETPRPENFEISELQNFRTLKHQTETLKH